MRLRKLTCDKNAPVPIKLSGRSKDLTGQRFGRWTVLAPIGRAKSRFIIWYCRCDCGAHKGVLTNRLKSGQSKSCGCYNVDRARELTIKRNTKGFNKYVTVGNSTGLVLTSKEGYVKGMAVIDTEDLDLVNSCRWFADRNGYIKNSVDVYMSRVLMSEALNSKTHLTVDHKDHNRFNNRKENLRVCTQRQNMANMVLPKDNTSGYKGVHYDKNRKKYQASIGVNGKKKYLGRFNDPKEAAKAYNSAAIKYFGDYAYLNII